MTFRERLAQCISHVERAARVRHQRHQTEAQRLDVLLAEPADTVLETRDLTGLLRGEVRATGKCGEHLRTRFRGGEESLTGRRAASEHDAHQAGIGAARFAQESGPVSMVLHQFVGFLRAETLQRRECEFTEQCQTTRCDRDRLAQVIVEPVLFHQRFADVAFRGEQFLLVTLEGVVGDEHVEHTDAVLLSDHQRTQFLVQDTRHQVFRHRGGRPGVTPESTPDARSEVRVVGECFVELLAVRECLLTGLGRLLREAAEGREGLAGHAHVHDYLSFRRSGGNPRRVMVVMCSEDRWGGCLLRHRCVAPWGTPSGGFRCGGGDARRGAIRAAVTSRTASCLRACAMSPRR